MADTIITNARVTTLDRANPEGQAIAIRDGLIQAVGPRDEIMRLADRKANVIDAGGRRVILASTTATRTSSVAGSTTTWS